MKQLNQSMCDFITTYKLEHPTKGICFEAKIYFFTEQFKIQTESEIHIVTIDGKDLDVVYILNPTMIVENMPTMFVVGDFEVTFNEYHGLKLKGSSSAWGKYTFVIQPTGRNCTEPTYKELIAKTYN